MGQRGHWPRRWHRALSYDYRDWPFQKMVDSPMARNCCPFTEAERKMMAFQAATGQHSDEDGSIVIGEKKLPIVKYAAFV